MTYWKRSIATVFVILLAGYLVTSLTMLVFSIREGRKVQAYAQDILTAAQSGSYQQAFQLLAKTEDSLASAQRLQKPSAWLRYLPFVQADYIVYESLLGSARELTASANTIISDISNAALSRSIDFSSIDFRSAPEAYVKVHPQIMSAMDSLDRAAGEAGNMHVEFLPEPYRGQVIRLREALIAAQKQAAEYRPYLEQLPYLLGSGEEQNMLILLQNPHELRPTGGFIGTFGRLTVHDGQIDQLFTDDVYNVDVKVLGREKLEAPQPIQTYTNVKNWYLRDANWSPDFPTAAQNIKALYEYESGEQDIDTVIAVTPYLVQKFLEITGPIEVDNISFTSENLIDAIQFRVEQEFWHIGLKDEERKKVINDLAQALRQRFFTLTKDEMTRFLSDARQTLDRREILLYTVNPKLQDLIKRSGWAGEIVQVSSDYLYVVDANLGALKTDRLLSRSRSYSVRQNEEGKWLAHVELTYANHGFFDYRTTRYRTYTRVYVPLGSELINSSGFVLTDKSFQSVPPQTYAEFQRTVFAGFLSVEPGQTRTITLDYQLPDRLAQQIAADHAYKLYVQKQPGVTDAVFTGRVSGEKPFFSFAPSSVSYKLKGASDLSFEDILAQDKKYTVVFQR